MMTGCGECHVKESQREADGAPQSRQPRATFDCELGGTLTEGLPCVRCGVVLCDRCLERGHQCACSVRGPPQQAELRAEYDPSCAEADADDAGIQSAMCRIAAGMSGSGHDQSYFIGDVRDPAVNLDDYEEEYFSAKEDAARAKWPREQEGKRGPEGAPKGGEPAGEVSMLGVVSNRQARRHAAPGIEPRGRLLTQPGHWPVVAGRIKSA